MPKFNLNQLALIKQRRKLSMVITIVVLAMMGGLWLMPAKSKPKKPEASVNLTGIMDDSFSESNTTSAMTAQQAELESLKTQLKELKASEALREKSQKEELARLVAESMKQATPPIQVAQNSLSQQIATDARAVWQSAMNHDANPYHAGGLQKPPHLHSVSFRYGKKHKTTGSRLSPEHYVPSGTFVRAVVLGGADADASVNGQSKNNGVMLFKLLQPGTLPNGQRSHMQGCFVTASSYGDISSERAYVVLDKLSCAQKGRPIIDKQVTGWAFFGGKVGIKGVPLMRDNKVMQWAGISGAMSGIAAAAQYSQSVQSISALGSATSVPSGNIAPYAAYGGASKAAEVLSNYYVKRAEQYHPVIQVGSGNLVTIVFKDGFYLEPDEKMLADARPRNSEYRRSSYSNHAAIDSKETDFNVPPEILNKIDSNYENHRGQEVNS